MWFVSPSFQGKEFLCNPYEKDGKMYVKVMGAKAPREVRVYDEWQSTWPAALKPRVERNTDSFLAFNYSEGYYTSIVGIENNNGREGFWRYKKIPTKKYSWNDNLILSPLFGYIGRLGRPVIQELEPEFVSIEKVRIENGFRRLITDEWWKGELERLSKTYNVKES